MANRFYFDPQIIDFPLLNKINEIFTASLAAIDPVNLTKNIITIRNNELIISKIKFRLADFEKIHILGIGKASQSMAVGAKMALSESNLSGLVITKNLNKNTSKALLPQIESIVGSHPIPDQKSVQAAQRMIEYSKNIGKNDLVICLISGGGSSLMTYLADGIVLKNIQDLTSKLLNKDANINEINTIRKHLDKMKGGGLLSLLYPAQVISLILSDVIGDDISMIASGPTVADKTTYHDAFEVLEKYDLMCEVDETILSHLRKGEIGQIPETLKDNDPKFRKINNLIIGNNATAIHAAKQYAESIGFNCQTIIEPLVGNSELVAQKLLMLVKENVFQKPEIKKPYCLITGGESTVIIKGNGKGGRNQDVALRCAINISGMDNVCMATLATDGEDGPTDAAGAIVTGKTIKLAKQKGLDPRAYLDDNDSYYFFEKVGGLIKTEPTGTNVNDLNFIFVV